MPIYEETSASGGTIYRESLVDTSPGSWGMSWGVTWLNAWGYTGPEPPYQTSIDATGDPYPTTLGPSSQSLYEET